MSVLGTRHSTPVIKRSLNPVYAAKDATFDFPIYLSTADKLGVIEDVIWDKDVVGVVSENGWDGDWAVISAFLCRFDYSELSIDHDLSQVMRETSKLSLQCPLP